MKRTSTDAEYLDAGKIVIDADGIPVDVPDRTHMEAADTALGQRIDAEKWRKPGLVADDIDTYNSVAYEGLWSVRASTPGNPFGMAGWLSVMRNGADGRIKQVFRPSLPGQEWTAGRTLGGGVWSPWVRGTWGQAALTSSDDLDEVHGQDSVGHYPLLSGVKHSPEGINGLMEVTYERGTDSTQQVVWSIIHTENGVAYRRVRRGGVWHDWTQVGWGSRQVSTAGDLDEQVRPGNYHIASSYTANAPVSEPGNMVVQIANNVIIQTFVTSGFHPRTFVRSRTAGMWSAWSEPGRRVSRPMSWDATTRETKPAHRIPAYMTHEGRYYWSVRAYRLFLSEDAGKTWDSDPIWRSDGEGSETIRELPNGELLMAVDHVGGDRVRDVWVSSGMSTNPRTATWTKTLPGRAPHIKYADGWSISVHENMVLLAEYGPKSFGTWQGTYIEEGQNARYVYLSEDYGMTWRTIFDLNTWLYDQGRTSMEHQHMHGIAYDPWWNRIWLTWGDNVAGNGSNGVLYSDDLGLTWETAMFVSDPGGTGIEGSPQVVGILPMEKCILFGGDQYPSGVMRIDRAGGKTRSKWSWQVAYQHHTGRHLCGAITPVTLPNGDKAAWFQFVPEGVSTTSFVVATRDGWDWDVLWESEVDDRLSALVGPTPDGEMIGGYLPAGTSDWVEVRGRADLYRTNAGAGAEIDEKADKSAMEAADTALGQRIDDEIPAAVTAGRRATILPDGADIKTLDPGTYITRSGVSSQSIIGAPPGVTQSATIQIEFTPADRVVKSITWTEWGSTGPLVWVATMSYGSLSQWARLDRLGTDGGTAHLNDLTVPGNYYFVTDSQTSLDRGFPVAKGGLLSVDRWRGSSYQLVQKYFPFRHEGFFLRFFYSGQPYEGTVGSGWMEFPTRKTITADIASALTSAQQYADQVAAEIRAELPPARSAIAQVACLGDSLTAGYSSGAAWVEADAWPSHLAATLGVEVAKLGFSGATTDVINIRTGVTPITFTVTGGVIPGARYSDVALTTGQRIGAWGDAGENFNSYGWLAGRYGLLKFDGTSYIFTTSDVGEDQAVEVAEFRGEFAGHEADTIVYMAGRNDITKTEQGVESSIVEHVLRANADVMEWATPRRKQVVLMGTITRTDETPGSVGFEQVREIRHRLRLMYPEHFLDVQGYLLSQDVWAHTGITPTQADLDAQARGMTPPSLFDDVTHYSRATARAIGEHLVAPFLVAKGWVVPTVSVPQAAGWTAPLSATHDTTLAIRRDTTVGTRIHVGDTLVHGRIGWRDITSLIAGAVTSGRLLVARTESTVWLHFDQLVMDAAGSGTLATLPTGWRPMVTQSATVQGVTSRAQVTAYGYVQVYNWTTAPMIGTVAFMPDGTWPTLYPGTPA